MLSRPVRDSILSIQSHIRQSDDPVIKAKDLALDQLLRRKDTTDTKVKDWFDAQLDLTAYLRKSPLAKALTIIEQSDILPLDMEVEPDTERKRNAIQLSLEPEIKTEKKQFAAERKIINPADILSRIDPEEIKAAEKRLSPKEDFSRRFNEAAHDGDLPMMCLLHSRGVDLNKVNLDDNGYYLSPFQAAVHSAPTQIEAALLLLQMGCQVQPEDVEWIIYKRVHTNLHLVPTLITEMRKRNDKLFPSEWAEWAYVGEADKLKNIKQGIYSTDITKLVSLHYACVGGHLDAVKTLCEIHQLLSDQSLDIQGESGLTPLMLAVASNHLEIVKLLVEKYHCNVNALRDNGISVLMYANSLPMLQYLVSKGASVWTSDKGYILDNILFATPESFGSTSNFLMTIEYILNQQPDAKARAAMVNYQDGSGYTPLYYEVVQPRVFRKPIEDDSFKFKEYLVQQGANVNIADHEGVSPLHFASGNGDIENVRFLLANKANLDIEDNLGRTSLFYVIESLKIEKDKIPPSKEKISKLNQVKEILIKAGASLYFSIGGEDVTLLHLAVKNNDVHEIEFLLAHDKSLLNASDSSGRTPLFYAQSPGMTELLLQHGANVNEKDNAGNTVLHLARSADLVKILKKYRADFNAETHLGYTPLVLALKEISELEYDELIVELIKNSVVDKDVFSAQMTRTTVSLNIMLWLFFQSMATGHLQEILSLKSNHQLIDKLKQLIDKTERSGQAVTTESHGIFQTSAILMRAMMAETSGNSREAERYLSEAIKDQNFYKFPTAVVLLGNIFKFKTEKNGFPKDGDLLKLEAKSVAPATLNYKAMSNYLRTSLQCAAYFPDEEKGSFYANLALKINKLLEADAHSPEEQMQFSALNKRKKESLQDQIVNLKAEAKHNEQAAEKLKIVTQLAQLPIRKQDALLDKLKIIQQKDLEKVHFLTPLLQETIKHMPFDVELSAQEHLDYAHLLMVFNPAEDSGALSMPERYTIASAHAQKAALKSTDPVLSKEAKILQGSFESGLGLEADFHAQASVDEILTKPQVSLLSALSYFPPSEVKTKPKDQSMDDVEKLKQPDSKRQNPKS